MSRTIVLELFLPFRLFKKTATIRCTTTSAQILNSHENKTKWRVALKRKTGAAAKHLLIEPWNHGTIEPSNQKSQIAQEYGLLPANARQQLARHQAPQWKKGETAKTKNVGTRSEPRGGLGRATTASVVDFSFSPFSHTAEPGPRLGVYETRNQRHEMGPWGVPIYVLDSYVPPDSF